MAHVVVRVRRTSSAVMESVQFASLPTRPSVRDFAVGLLPIFEIVALVAMSVLPVRFATSGFAHHAQWEQFSAMALVSLWRPVRSWNSRAQFCPQSSVVSVD